MSFPFYFLRYLKPLWYYHLRPRRAVPYFVDYRRMNPQEQALVEWDPGYSSEDVSLLDAAWQAWNRGLIVTDPSKGLAVDSIRPSIDDNYRFLRKYFRPIWSWYVLVLRLLSGHHPVREVRAFLRSRLVRPVNLFAPVMEYAQYETAWDAKDGNAPLVSVIIPTLNRYEYLQDVLRDLEKQDYPNFEVIVVDQSEPFRPDFYRGFRLALRLIRQEEKALWRARNDAIRAARGDYLLLFDDDSRVAPDWITHHVRCIQFFGADLSSGVSISVVGAPVPAHYAFFRWSDQLDTGNVLIRRAVFEGTGLFDRQFEGQRMGDGEFGLRAYLAGFRNVSNPRARRLHLKVGSGGLRQMGSWDAFRPKKWWAPRPIPSVLYLARRYYGDRTAFLMLLQGVPPALVPYQWKRRRALLLLGFLLLLIAFPVVIGQVIRSWRIATRMLQEGPQIDPLPPRNH